MTNITLHLEKVYDFVSNDEIKSYKKETERQNVALHEKTGKGNDFLDGSTFHRLFRMQPSMKWKKWR